MIRCTILLTITSVMFLFFSVCSADICEAHTIDGFDQRAYGCPRLDDPDIETFCCQHNSSRQCCDNEELSIYPNQTSVDTNSYGNFIGKIIVLAYGFVVVVLVVVDAISHFVLKPKKAEIFD